MEQTTQTTDAVAEQAAANSEELRQLAEGVGTQVGQLRRLIDRSEPAGVGAAPSVVASASSRPSDQGSGAYSTAA